MEDIIGLVEKWVVDTPDAALFTFLDGAGQITESYSYRTFHERTNRVAACLEETGKIGIGKPVLLVYPPGLDFIVAFIACVKLGALPVPVPPPDASGFVGGVEKLALVTSDSGAEVALTSRAYLRQLDALAERSTEVAQRLALPPLAAVEWLATDEMQGTAATFRSRPGPLLFLQYTSGSTQSPRGVMVSHANVIHNCRSTLGHRPVAVSWLPHYHDMGLIGYFLFIMLTGGSAYWFSGAAFLRRPLLWLETIARYRATITSAPNSAFEYCLRDDRIAADKIAGLDLSSLRCVMNASEPVRGDTHDRFVAKFAPCGLSPRAMEAWYGLAENTLSVTGEGRIQLAVNQHLIEQNILRIEMPREDRLNQLRLVSCGRPLAGIDVRIVDGKTCVDLGTDGIGEIWVGGDSKTQGYWRKPDASEALFDAVIRDDQNGATYLRTGDVGFLHDGELFVCGRVKDVVIIGGRNYYPSDIEAVLERSSPRLRQGCIAAFAIERPEGGEGIVGIAEAARPSSLPDLAMLCREVRKHCHIELDALAIVPHGTVAKTSSGKVARQLCRRRWLDGEIPVLTMRQRSAPVDTAGSLAALLAGYDLATDGDRTLGELGIDSLSLVELSLHIEGILAEQDSIAAERAAEVVFDLRLLQAITLSELQGFLAEERSTGAPPRLVPRHYVKRLRAIDREERRLMLRDARLPDDIAAREPRRSDGKLLLTGVTGFLGAFLLAELLRLTDRDIVCLVRAQDSEHARARSVAALERTGLYDGELRARFARRVVAVPGDISRPRLGLSERQWDGLAEEVSAIYHCAAEVDYVKSYRALREANVGGTVELLRLACQGPTKAMHYVSTTFIFGFAARRFCREAESNAEMAELNFGYAQTKWAAEQIVLAACQRGLPVKCYRPSLVTASRQGRYVRGDLTARLLAYMISHGVSVDAENQISLLPVDVCAGNIVALSLLEEPTADVFHLTADRHYTMQDVCSQISCDYGYDFVYRSIDGFIEHMNAHCSKADPLYPLMAFFNQNHKRIEAMGGKRYDNGNYRRARKLSEIALPEPALAETVGGIVAFLRHEYLVPPEPVSRGEPAELRRLTREGIE